MKTLCEKEFKPQWISMLGKDAVKSVGETAKEIEFFLRRVIWMAENVPDDHIVWPIVKIVAPSIVDQDWGVSMEDHHSEEELGAYAFAAPFKDGIDLSKLKPFTSRVDEAALKIKKEKASELTGGLLDVYTFIWNLEYSPFDVAAKMRGL
ncbi:MAG: hypothetical protein JNL74_10985, partial [Fibrobacteres bacterium]|nr:hypothetical protein [Fibrobacterota bacterium]